MIIGIGTIGLGPNFVKEAYEAYILSGAGLSLIDGFIRQADGKGGIERIFKYFRKDKD